MDKKIGKELVGITKGLQLKYLAFDSEKDEQFAEKNNVKYCDLSSPKFRFFII